MFFVVFGLREFELYICVDNPNGIGWLTTHDVKFEHFSVVFNTDCISFGKACVMGKCLLEPAELDIR